MLIDKMNQKSRKDLAHVRAFTTISTKHTAASYHSRKTILKAAHGNHVDAVSSTLLLRGLTFVSDRQDSATTDAMNVQAVPSNFVGISKPSEIVERLITKRRNNHENSLQEMKRELDLVHEECVNEIRERSIRIKIQIDNIRANIEEARRNVQEADLLRLSDKNLRSTWDSIKNLVTEEKNCINTFHECLKEIEHSRRPRVKAVMQKYYEIFHTIAYISPFEIQLLLESKIHDYNKTVLKNFKFYENLHLDMNIQVYDWTKELQNWLEEIKKRRRDAISSENFEQLIRRKGRLEQAEEFFLYDPVGQFALKELSSKLNQIEESISNCKSTIIIFDESSVNDCANQLLEGVTELKISSTKHVESYKSALQKMSEQYEREVETFKAANKTGFWEEDLERLNKAVRSLRDTYEIATAKLENLWDQHISGIQSSIEEICSFLRGFNSIWKTQASRLVELQENTGKFVDDLTSKSEKTIVELQKKAITYNQQLREAANEDKMKQQLTQIFSTLDLICENYKFAYKEECKAVEKYLENVFNEVPKIVEQFHKFIGSYDQNIIKNSEESITTDFEGSEPIFVRQQLRMCRNLSPTIYYWKTTLLNEIMAFRETFSEATQEAAQEWQRTILDQRSLILQTKLEDDLQRREDIKINIYNVRVYEIESHSKRLEEHKEEVQQILQDASSRLDEFLQDQNQFFQNYKADIVEASKQIRSGKSTTAINRLQKETEKIREAYKMELEQKIKVHQEELRNILESLENKNDNFLNEIKLFKEGGNFSLEEAKFYRQSLTLCGKTVAKSKITNMQKIVKTFDELSKAIEKDYKTTVDSINTTTRELKFYEDAQKILTKCAVIIERQVYRLFDDNTKFVNAVVNNIKEFTIELCENSNIEVFVDQCIQLLDFMDSRLDDLMIGFPIAKSNSVDGQVKPIRKVSKGNERKRQKSIEKGTNYRNLFIGSAEKLSCEKCFSTKAMNTMLKTIDEIQTKAMTFFSPSPKRRDSQANFREYMQEILHQLQCYLTQLEYLWREEVEEILIATEAFERTTSESILKILNNFHEKHMNEMMLVKETKLRELKKTVKVYSDRRNKMHDSLEVSHGHPERKDTLDKLTEEIMEEDDGMQNAITDELTEYKIALNNLLSSYETSLKIEAETLRKILIKFEDHGKRQRLTELFEKHKRSNLPELAAMSYRIDLPVRVNRRTLIYTDNLESAKYKSFDIESIVNQLAENAREVFASAVNEWEIEVNSFLEDGENFKQTWNRNIKIVSEVYEAIL